MKVDKSKWEKVRLIDVAPICPSSENSANSVVWLLNLDMIESQTGKIIRKQYCDKKDIGTSVIQFTNSHVLWSKLRPYLNKVVLPDENGYATSELIPLLPNRIKRKYLFHLLMSKWFVTQMVASAEGARMPRASMKEFRKLTIALPSEDEQTVIAEELDGIQSMIGKCREQLEDYDRLARSIFHEMFGDPVRNDKGWEMKTLGDCGLIVTGNTPSKKKKDNYNKRDYLFVKPGDFRERTITKIEHTEDALSIQGFEQARKIPAGAVLVTCIGTIGKVGISMSELSCNQQINAIVPNADVCNLYLSYAVSGIRTIMSKQAHGPVVPIINKTAFSAFVIPLSPLPLQQQFAARIEAIEAMKEATKAQLADLQQLFDSRMQYYFS